MAIRIAVSSSEEKITTVSNSKCALQAVYGRSNHIKLNQIAISRKEVIIQARADKKLITLCGYLYRHSTICGNDKVDLLAQRAMELNNITNILLPTEKLIHLWKKNTFKTCGKQIDNTVPNKISLIKQISPQIL